MRIGLDFDNTIVCYDQAITVLAEEVFELPKEMPRTKLALRDFLRAAGREREWTSFQGALYGPGMHHAQPFDGAISTMQQLASEGHELVIISHRSRWPYAGPTYDLHEAARGWVADNLQSLGLFGNKGDEDHVYFLETRDQKVEMITFWRCNVFLDDLAEVLCAPSFPSSTLGIHFCPGEVPGACEESGHIQITSWLEFPIKLRVQ
jgi:hypothetical protein